MTEHRNSEVLWVVLLYLAVASLQEATAQSKKILRYKDSQGHVGYGVLEDRKVHGLLGSLEEFMAGEFRLSGQTAPLDAITLLPPVAPSKIIAFGWTYGAHAREVGGEVNRKDPLVFLKPPTVIISDRDTIRCPHALSSSIEFEGELAIIIGRKAKDITPDHAGNVILGFTCFNDVTARDLTQKDPEFTRGKGFDTFGPIGPWIVTGVNANDLRLITRLNGQVKQDARTSEMIYDIPFLVSYISNVMTLLPGDIIATGTPGGSAQMKSGDIVEVEIEGIGVLTNPVK